MEKTIKNWQYAMYATVRMLEVILTLALSYGYRDIIPPPVFLSLALLLIDRDLNRDLKQLTTMCEEKELEKRCLEQAIGADHGGNLKEVMAAIRDESVEYLAIFDREGKKLAESTLLSPFRCTMVADDWERIYRGGKQIVEVHNHPRSDNAFSELDFRAFFQKDFIRQSIVVTKHYNFILEKPFGGYEHLMDDVEAYVKKLRARCRWLSVFSDHLTSIVVAWATAFEYGLEFKIRRVYRAPKIALKTLLKKAA